MHKPELADVVKKFGMELIKKGELLPQQTKVLFDILRCRTAKMGGHEEKCDCCNNIRYSYNSCGNRHCPKCQGTKQAIWVEKLSQTTLPIKHFHIIFTVPHCLNAICLWKPKMYYKLLFAAVWGTLRTFGYTHFGAETGAVAVLHTWGQNLSLHPHIHCIVPTAGYTLKGEWKTIGKTSTYLYPVGQLSSTFKGKFLDSLDRQLRKETQTVNFGTQLVKAKSTNWVVNSQASTAGAEHVIRYLGQYTHRIAISNHRILSISDTHVKFIAKDYRDGAKKKIKELTGLEFLKRFCLHIVPKRFVRIRWYGIYNPTTIRNMELQFVPDEKPDIEQIERNIIKETTQEKIKRLTGFDVTLCPVCKKGKMHVVRKLPRIRSPGNHLPTLLVSMLQ